MLKVKFISFIFMFVLMAPVIANTLNTNTCEKEYAEILHGNTYPTHDAKLKYWHSLKNKCGGSGFYEYRLGVLSLQAGDLGAANTAFKQGLALHSPYQKEILLGMSDLALAKGDTKGGVSGAEELMREYPNWFAGYQQMGSIKLRLGDFADSIPYFVNATRREHKDWFSYGSLAIAYQRLGDYRESIAALGKAFGIDQYSVGSQRDMMLAGASAYVSVGKLDIAHGVLMILLKYNPQERNDPQFVKLITYVEQKLQKQAK